MARHPRTRRMRCSGLTGMNDILATLSMANGDNQSKAHSSTRPILLPEKRSQRLRRDRLQISTRLSRLREMLFRNGNLSHRMRELGICTPWLDPFRDIRADRSEER